MSEALSLALPELTFVHAIPHTTRAAREGEVEGEDYYFVSMETMMAGLSSKMFIEAGKFNVCCANLILSCTDRLHPG